MNKQSATKKISISHWVSWIIASLLYAYQCFIRVLPNIMMPQIMEKFHIDATSFGQFAGVYYLGYAVMHIPIGIALDRFGPRVVMAICSLLIVGGIAPLLYSDYWIHPIIGRVLIGMGSSGAILGVFKIIRTVFPQGQFSRMLGISVTIGLFGSIYGGQPVVHCIEQYGYQSVVTFIALIGIVLSLSIFLLMPKHQHKPSYSNIYADLRKVLGNRFIIAICLFSGLMVGPLEGFADAWGAEFLKIVYHFNADSAATTVSLIFFGMSIGCNALSYIADKSSTHIEWIIVAAITMTACFVVLLSGRIPQGIIWLVFLSIGIMCGYQVLAVYKTCTHARKEHVGIATAIANMFIMSFGYVFHSVIGEIIHIQSGHISNDNNDFVGLCDPSTFVYAVAIIPSALMVGALGFIIVRKIERKSVPLGQANL